MSALRNRTLAYISGNSTYNFNLPVFPQANIQTNGYAAIFDNGGIWLGDITVQTPSANYTNPNYGASAAYAQQGVTGYNNSPNYGITGYYQTGTNYGVTGANYGINGYYQTGVNYGVTAYGVTGYNNAPNYGVTGYNPSGANYGANYGINGYYQSNPNTSDGSPLPNYGVTGYGITGYFYSNPNYGLTGYYQTGTNYGVTAYGVTGYNNSPNYGLIQYNYGITGYNNSPNYGITGYYQTGTNYGIVGYTQGIIGYTPATANNPAFGLNYYNVYFKTVSARFGSLGIGNVGVFHLQQQASNINSIQGPTPLGQLVYT